MAKQIYGGYIMREYLDANDFIGEVKSNNKIFVKAWDINSANLLIHEVYSRNEKKWTPNRTSDKFLGDKVYVGNLKVYSDLGQLIEDSL